MRRFLTPGWIAGHLLVILAVFTCLRLGLWQWDRAHAAGGDGQNLGYSMLWPAFGAAFVYMWVRFLSLERKRRQEDESLVRDADILAAGAEDESSVAPVTTTPESTERVIAVGIVGDEDWDDPQLIEYNRALAALAEEEHRRGR